MTDYNLFFENNGGILDIKKLPDGPLKDQLQNFLYFCNLSIGVENDFELFPELIQNYVSGNRRTPHISKVFVLNNNDINAFAGIRDGKSIIGVFSGFPLLLNSFFLSILADETIFNNMDDVYHLNPKAFNVKELVDETSNNSIYNREFIENNWQVIRNSIPRAHPNNLINWTNSKLIINRNRANLALQLAQQAAFFFTFHELGHIVMGHAGYLQNRDLNAFLEFDQESNRSSNQMLSFGFEYQADDYAIDRMVDTFYADVPEARPFGERFSAMTKMSPVSRFRLWITTIGSLFLLLEAVRLAKNRNLLAKVMASKQSHPFPSNRFYNLIHTSILFSEKNYHFDRTIFDAAVENSIKDLEIIAKFLNVEQPSINDELAMVRGKNTAMKVLMEIESDLIKYRQIVI